MRAKLIKKSSSCNNSGQKNVPLLDTLAQLETGTENQSVTSYYKRAVAKYQTQKLVYRLIDLHSDLYESYWMTKYCSSVLLQHDKTLTSTYCNNRWCIVCNRIRTAKLIKGYLPEIKKFKDPQFVTTTIVNTPPDGLKTALNEMIRISSKINNTFRRRKDFHITGLRKIECTYNKEENSYHLHIHWIVDGIVPAKALVKAWLSNFPDANRAGQDIRPADEKSLIEMFKYATKLVAKDNQEARALDVIFSAFKRKRVFQPIGMRRYVSEDIDEVQSQEIKDLKVAVDTWVWKQEVSDWINLSGEGLTGCQEYRKDEKGPCHSITQPEIVAPEPSCGVGNEVFDQDRQERAISDFAEDRIRTIEAFEAGERGKKKLICNLNTGQIYDYQKVNIEKDILYMVTDSEPVT